MNYNNSQYSAPAPGVFEDEEDYDNEAPLLEELGEFDGDG